MVQMRQFAPEQLSQGYEYPMRNTTNYVLEDIYTENMTSTEHKDTSNKQGGPYC